MGILARRIQANASPADEGAWISTSGDMSLVPSLAGMTVTNESAMRLSAVYACVDLIARVLAMIPAKLYDKVPAPDGQYDKRQSRDPFGGVIGAMPNDEQGRFEFIYQMTAWALFRRHVCAEVVRDRGSVTALWPLEPDRLRRMRIEGTRRHKYLYRDPGSNQYRTILADDIFRLPGAAVLDYARESFGFAQAVQTFASRTFAKGVRPSGFIAREPNVKYTEQALTDVQDAIEKNHAGPGNAGGVLMLPEGLKWNQLGMTNEQAEFAATATFSVVECARWFAVPPYKVNVTAEGTMSFASVEAQSIDLVIYTFLPWGTRWEGAIQRLIGNPESPFMEFLWAYIMKGTTKERFDAYAVGIQWGFMSPQQVRRLENWNAVPGLDVFLRPLNMTPAALAAAKEAGISAWSTIEEQSPATRLAKLLATDTAGRIVRREISAMGRLAEKHGADEQAWQASVEEFYNNHPSFVAQALKLPLGAALSYSREQRDELLADGPAVIARWEADGKVDDLAALALSEASA